jgi:hypothetical protein
LWDLLEIERRKNLIDDPIYLFVKEELANMRESATLVRVVLLDDSPLGKNFSMNMSGSPSIIPGIDS